jgi:SAM-dependent methyltransferase
MKGQGLDQASAVWDTRNETLDDVNRRIHDGVPLEQLASRANGIVDTIASLYGFPHIKGASILEIGSGVGFLMQAMERRIRDNTNRSEIIGLDISHSMIEKARQRLSDDPAYKDGVLQFVSYDGITMPFTNGRFDFVYSVAVLQHIPKPYVYNLFFEIKRVLKNTGVAVLQFLPFSLLPEQEKNWPWLNEIKQQIGLAPSSHWHHYYSEDELHFVLREGTGFPHVRIVKIHSNLWACVSKGAALNRKFVRGF